MSNQIEVLEDDLIKSEQLTKQCNLLKTCFSSKPKVKRQYSIRKASVIQPTSCDGKKKLTEDTDKAIESYCEEVQRNHIAQMYQLNAHKLTDLNLEGLFSFNKEEIDDKLQEYLHAVREVTRIGKERLIENEIISVKG